MKISKFVDVNQKNLEITSKMMENIWKFTAKPGKIIEKSLNFVSLEKWEPWLQSIRLVTMSVSLCTQTGSLHLTIQVRNV